MRYIKNIPVWGEPIYNAVEQMQNCAEEAEACALMADHHLGYSQPIGGVVAYKDHISPSGVGFDIACGNKAVKLDLTLHQLDAGENFSALMDKIASTIQFGTGKTNPTPVQHQLFDDGDPAWNIPAVKALKDLAYNQLGTTGSGNHYVDVFVDEDYYIWIGVHFGSRGFGHKIATHFLKAGGGKDSINAKPTLLHVNSDLGEQYIKAMRLAGRYAYAGRDWVCSTVANIFNADIIEEIHNHHNFAWQEEHGGQNLWVVRKGATPAFPGQLGFVGGSLGDVSYIIQGKEETTESRLSLFSTIHGAGRVMSRRKAKENLTLRDVTLWLIKNHMSHVLIRGSGLDEAPQAYKRIETVISEHAGTVEIVKTLTPLGVVMA